MKKKLIYLIAITIALTSCNNSGSNKNSENDSAAIAEANSANNEDDADNEAVEDEQDPEGKLAEYLKNKELAFEQFKKLKTVVANQDRMNTIDDVENALRMRDSLINLLNNDESFYTYMEEGDRFYDDFKVIGIQVVEAEGMFGNLDQAPLLEKVIERVADEPYILNNKIKNLNASTHGSEYPFFDISEEMELVPLAEKMLTKYPGHKYNKEIVKMLEEALYPLTDIHVAPEDFSNYIVGGYDVNAYPGATDISYHKTFIEKYSKSRFAKIVKKILENTSTLSAREFDKLYLVQVPDLKSESVFADGKLNEQLKTLPKDVKTANNCLKYMWLGIDIPHVLNLRNGDENNQVCVYRFFDKKEPAEKCLAEIRKIIPSAKLVEYQLTEQDKKNKN